MVAALLIVFREAVEAGLIVGIVLAATKGVPRSRWWIGCGVAGGALGACLLAGFAGQLADLFEGSGQELFNATILLVAVMMLTWHNVWMASHGRAMSRELKKVGAAVAAGEEPMLALATVVGVAVLREGSEVVLFLYGIAASGGSTAGSMILGGTLGIMLGAGMTVLMYFGLLSIPPGRLFSVTSGLITLLAAGMASQAVAFLQQGGYAATMTRPLWNTGWILSEGSVGGRMLHTLIGYSEAPTALQLVAYSLTIMVILSLMRLVRGQQAPARPVSA
jgi:high-affinity iron transporter